MKKLSTHIILLIFFICYQISAHDLSDLYQKVKKSVVVIHTVERNSSQDELNHWHYNEFLGSGVLIDKNRILTAAHVVQTAKAISVQFYDGMRYDTKIIASSFQADVALLELIDPPQKQYPASIGNSDAVEIGQEVFVIGAPYGMTYSLTAGHISGRIAPDDVINEFAGMEFFQTDAAINEGNSGGPLFNRNGEVIGIVSYILTQSGGYEGIGFAASTSVTIKMLIEERTMWTGSEGYLLNEIEAQVLNVPQSSGLLVQKLAGDAPIAKIGIRAGSIPVEVDGKNFLAGGDIVLKVAGIEVKDKSSVEEIRKSIISRKKGEIINIVIWRHGKKLELKLKI